MLNKKDEIKMSFIKKIEGLFSKEKMNEDEMHKDIIDLLEDELNFEDRNAGLSKLDLKDTKRLKHILNKYDLEHVGTDKDGSVIMDDGGGQLKIKETGNKLEIFELN